MDKIPSEICLYISTLACIDNGFTGRSLSQVSQYVREVSQTVKLQSICLHGHDQILAFAELIEHTPATVRKVRQLFICNEKKRSSDTPQSASKPGNRPSVGRPHSPGNRERRRLQSKIAQNAYRERRKRWKIIDQATATILANVGSTIERLAISFGPAPVLSEIREPLFLPNLVDLTITNCPLSWLAPSHRLHRLHVIYKHFADILGTTSMSVVPALEKLKISGMHQSQHIPVNFPDTLQEILISLPIPPAVFGYITSPPLLNHDELIHDLLLKYSSQQVVVLGKEDTSFVSDALAEERLWLENLAYCPSRVSAC